MLVVGTILLFSTNVIFAETEEAASSLANIPLEELPGAQEQEVVTFDEGRKCKRTRKTGSNRITRVCTTRAEREKAHNESTAWLREKQLEQERLLIDYRDTGSVTPL